MRTSAGELSGFDVRYWRRLADELDLEYELVLTTLEDKLAGVRDGRYDVALGGVSVTSGRAQVMDFSVPYFNAGLSVAVGEVQPGIANTQAWMAALLHPALAVSVGVLLLFTFVCGNFLWLAERSNPGDAISAHYVPGVFQATWLAFATATTIGYGDIAPKRWVGRLITVPLALVGFLVLSSVMSSISSTLTLHSLKHTIAGPRDLQGRRTGVKDASTAFDAVRRYQGVPVPFADLSQAVAALQAGDVEAIVADTPAVRFLSSELGERVLTVVGEPFDDQYYAFAFPAGSTLRKQVSIAHLRLVESSVDADMYADYFRSAD